MIRQTLSQYKMVRVRDYKRGNGLSHAVQRAVSKMSLSPAAALCAVLMLVLAVRLAFTEEAGKLNYVAGKTKARNL